ncbi:CsgG/HfaB family protein [Nioella nitratireducens]|uniref:CsgG/HfaB family protein n=1 Tax=Nioella nitratireducens TaxID=1287720 RepID=UPI0008FCFCBB|nr:CsgG/HfaB family protein [Nioella nitratireducens]
MMPSPAPWSRLRLASALAICAAVVSGCSGSFGAFTPPTRNMVLPDGPPVEEIVTVFDDALQCLRGQVPGGVTFGVGQVVDATGRESYAEGASGRFLSQGAGEMVQSALFRAGAAVVNRRNPDIAVMETQWGIRDIRQQLPVNFYITGSINSLDFIPGGGTSFTVAGVGPQYRQSRILVGLDLSLTDAFTGRIVASVPLQRQMFSREFGASIGRFFGDTLVSLDAGGQQREAVHFVLRQMLSLATFELVGQLVDESTYRNCRSSVAQYIGGSDQFQTGAPEAIQAALATASDLATRDAAAPQQAAAAQEQPSGSREVAALSVEDHIQQLNSQASVLGARAIAAAEEALAAETLDVQAQKTAEALQLVRAAGQYLRRAAELGLTGPAGDATAIVVQRALEMATEANDRMSAAAENGTDAPAPSPSSEATGSPAAAVPGTPEYERIPGAR